MENRYTFTETDERSKLVRFKVRMNEALEKVENAKRSLLLLAGLTLLTGIFDFIRNETITSTIIYISLIISYLGCYFIAKAKPKIGFIAAFIIFFLSVVLPSILNPESLFTGILWKVFFVVVLGAGIYSIYRAENLKKEYERRLAELDEKELRSSP